MTLIFDLYTQNRPKTIGCLKTVRRDKFVLSKPNRFLLIVRKGALLLSALYFVAADIDNLKKIILISGDSVGIIAIYIWVSLQFDAQSVQLRRNCRRKLQRRKGAWTKTGSVNCSEVRRCRIRRPRSSTWDGRQISFSSTISSPNAKLNSFRKWRFLVYASRYNPWCFSTDGSRTRAPCGLRVERKDPLCFLTGCRKRRQNQTLFLLLS